MILVLARILRIASRPFRKRLPSGFENIVTALVFPPILPASNTFRFGSMKLSTVLKLSNIFLRNGQAVADTYIGPGPLLTVYLVRKLLVVMVFKLSSVHRGHCRAVVRNALSNICSVISLVLEHSERV